MRDFSKTLFRPSAMGQLMTDPQSKADKEAGNLAKTAKKYLFDVYIKEMYGRERDVQTKYMKKGVGVEDEAIDTLSVFMKTPMEKNKELFKNEYIKGTPDVVLEKLVIDVKSSYDLWTFIANVPEELNSDYYWQLMSYLWLTGKQNGFVAYVLLDTPMNIVEQEKYYLLKKMDVVSEESPEFLKEAAKLEYNMTFGDVPIEDRILLFSVKRDDEQIARMMGKIQKAREFLTEIEYNHKNFNKKFYLP